MLPPNIIPVGLFLGAHIKYALLYALCNWHYEIYSNTPRNYTSINVSLIVYFYAYKMLILPYASSIGPLVKPEEADVDVPTGRSCRSAICNH